MEISIAHNHAHDGAPQAPLPESGMGTIAQYATVRRLRQMVQSSSDDLILLDDQLRVLFANRQLTFTGAPRDGVGCSIADLLPTRGRAAALTCLRQALRTGAPDRFEIEVAEPHARQRFREIRVAPVRERERVIGLALNVSDTTSHVVAQRAVAMQAKMIESMLEGVALINHADDIVIANPAFERLFGFARGALIGWPLAQLAEAACFDVQHLQRSDRGCGPWSVEFDIVRSDGAAATAAGALSRLQEAKGAYRLLVLQDVSERKLLERAMLEAVNREQDRIGNDLHDGLGQELTGIALMLRCLASRLAVEHRQAVPDLEGITQLVGNAVESTRSLARGLSPIKLERGGLQDALAGLAMYARDAYGVKASFVNRCSGYEQLQSYQSNHLYRIAQEAVVNAVKHGRARTVRMLLSCSRGRARLTIADDGVGMPHNAHTRAGLGLRLMRYRAHSVRGDLHFESVKPSGTRVVCECPIEEPLVQVANSKRRGARVRTKRSMQTV